MKKIYIYSYTKVWKVQKKIYSIQNFRLPFPADPWFLAYFGGCWIFSTILFRIIPGAKWIPGIVRSGVVPYALAKFLMTQKLDGKNPLSYFRDIILFLLLDQGTVVEHFRKVPEKEKVVHLNWNCSEGYR